MLIQGIRSAGAGGVRLSPQVPPQIDATQPINFKLITEGTKRGKVKLVSSDGFSYAIKYKGTKATTWACTARGKNNSCSAFVKQTGRDQFMIGPLPHSHPGTVGIVEQTELSAKIKMAATDRNTLSAMNLVERSILDGGLANYVPNPQNLKRMVNRSRQKGRPAEPKNVYSTIVPSYVHVPNEFLISDIKIEDEAGRIEARHLLLASETQIGFLKRASTWYIDDTFKAADDKLFKQAFGIHAFLHCGDNIKQVPLLTVLMTRRTKADYRAVFTDIARYLGSEIGLEDCLMDFEIATWKTIREVFPGVNI